MARRAERDPLPRRVLNDALEAHGERHRDALTALVDRHASPARAPSSGRGPATNASARASRATEWPPGAAPPVVTDLSHRYGARMPDPVPPRDASTETLRLRTSPRRLVRAVAWAAACVVGAGIASELTRHVLDRGRLMGLVPLFDLDGEGNVPAFFSALLLLTVAVLLALVACERGRRGLPHARAVWGLAAIAGFLAVDEAAGIHELLTAPLRAGLHAGGPAHFTWVAGYAVAAAVVALAYARLIPRLGRDLRRALAVAIAVYLVGALGMEVVAGAYLDSYDGSTRNAVYGLMTTVEEALEIGGLVLLVGLALRVLRDHAPRISLGLDGDGTTAPVTVATATAAPGPRHHSRYAAFRARHVARRTAQ